MVDQPPPELKIGQDDQPPDLRALLIVVLRLLNRILIEGDEIDRERVRAVRNAVRRYRQMQEGS